MTSHSSLNILNAIIIRILSFIYTKMPKHASFFLNFYPLEVKLLSIQFIIIKIISAVWMPNFLSHK